jgi:hypothetical protein
MLVHEPSVAVLAVIRCFFPEISGGETCLNQLVRELARIGHSVTVLTARLP